MTEIPTVVHAYILDAIRDAQADVLGLRGATPFKSSYMGFELVERTLADYHAALSGERDKARVVEMLEKAIHALVLLREGGVAPAVERTLDTLQVIVEVLEESESKNGLEKGAAPYTAPRDLALSPGPQRSARSAG